jgi:DNA-binding CsgD family transcriptional regulator
MARPCKQIAAKQVERMASLGCSQREIGEILGCSPDTLQRRYAAPLKKGYAKLNMSLRKAQIDTAIKRKNVTMLIWLGKQRLGQRNLPAPEGQTNQLQEFCQELRRAYSVIDRQDRADQNAHSEAANTSSGGDSTPDT